MPGKQAGQDSETHRLRVLIIDDERRSRETLQKLLEMSDSRLDIVALADSVESGCAGIRQHKPDLVFLDIELPDGDGFDILATFRDRSFAVIIVSAYSRYRIRALEYTPSDYLLKPVTIRELQNALARVRAGSGT